MKVLTKNVRRPVLFALGLTVLAVALALFLPTDSAAAPCGTEFDYFSDASYSQWVGAVAYTPSLCGCVRTAWGTVTSYVLPTGTYCVPPPRD